MRRFLSPWGSGDDHFKAHRHRRPEDTTCAHICQRCRVTLKACRAADTIPSGFKRRKMAELEKGMRRLHITAQDERDFERRHISSLRDRYLATDVLERVQHDPGYQEKILLIEDAIRGTQGLILDVGANTCGEAEVLSTRGFSMVALDVNDVALAISQERVQKFRDVGPRYVAGDAHRIPIQSGRVEAVVCFESLHHLEDPTKALTEINRVLMPDGKVFLYEPYAYNPYRRISELRDWFKGTIEKSFGANQLRELLTGTGFDIRYLGRRVLPPSEWKKQNVNRLRRLLKDAYHGVSRVFPGLFGSLVAVAVKREDSS